MTETALLAAAAAALIDGGATVPFIARYRKEVTGGLDDTQLRNLAERLAYLRELQARRILVATGHDLPALMRDRGPLRVPEPGDFSDEHFGLPTVRDIMAELEKPGRDPRPAFRSASFADGEHEITDLRPRMSLEGVVSNVAAFGAFVDIGVHQDGLVHVSHLADRFVKDPNEVVKPGDVVPVRVLEVDVARKRIGLSMRREGGTERSEARGRHGQGTAPKPRQKPHGKPGQGQDKATQTGALVDALIDAMRRK